MKTYEEMAESALTRGKAIRKQQMENNRILFGSLAALAICCAAVLLRLGAEEWGRPTNEPLNYGEINYFTADDKVGKGFQYVAGTANPGSIQPDAAPPRFEFRYGYIHVVAKAIEEVGIYETLNGYGSTQTRSYRVFAMQVVDPLESGMETGLPGTFFYLLPSYLQGDLTKYDALLISMQQLPKNTILRKGDTLTVLQADVFIDPWLQPELGNIIAFTNGVFDESLWQNETWFFGYQFAKYQLDRNDETLLVRRGSTLKESLQRRQAQIEEWGEWARNQTVMHYDFQSKAAKEVMAYVAPFINGVFVPGGNKETYFARRYINGCPTNEWIQINIKDETIRKRRIW